MFADLHPFYRPYVEHGLEEGLLIVFVPYRPLIQSQNVQEVINMAEGQRCLESQPAKN